MGQNKANHPIVWTVKDILQWTTERFTKKNFKTPRLDAEILLSKSLGKDRLYLYLNLDKPLTPGERKRMRNFVKRRLKLEPIAYITEEKEFYSTRFIIHNGVLVPRPETESLIDYSQTILSERKDDQICILDLCSGSGIIGITLRSIFKNSIVFMIEKDNDSIKTSSSNLELTGFLDILLLKADLKHLPVLPVNEFTLIVSNPPYISEHDMQNLSPEIRLYEKNTALYGGCDGCAFLPHIYCIVSNFLKHDGFALIEFPRKQIETAKNKLKDWTGLQFFDNIYDHGKNVQGFAIKHRGK